MAAILGFLSNWVLPLVFLGFVVFVMWSILAGARKRAW